MLNINPLVLWSVKGTVFWLCRNRGCRKTPCVPTVLSEDCGMKMIPGQISEVWIISCCDKSPAFSVLLHMVKWYLHSWDWWHYDKCSTKPVGWNNPCCSAASHSMKENPFVLLLPYVPAALADRVNRTRKGWNGFFDHPPNISNILSHHRNTITFAFHSMCGWCCSQCWLTFSLTHSSL